jgi:hypothetical protein
MPSPPQRARAGIAALATLGIGFFCAPARAQISQPGSHPDYSVELEPHLLLGSDEFWGSDGVGLGARISIPVIDNGPVTSINDNFAIGFGFDWSRFDGNCADWGPWWPGAPPPPGGLPPGGPPPGAYDCTGDTFWFPAVAQWNFFFTRSISAFGEGGLAVRYSTWGADYPCAGGICRPSFHDLGVDPLFFVGARFLVAKSFGITVRLGWPYLSVGASFLL